MRRFCACAAVTFLMAMVACGGSGSQSTSLSSVLAAIQISGASPNLVVGQTQQMTASGLYADKSTHDLTSSVTWSSSDSTIASVSSAGMVAANKSGQAVITASLKGISGTFNLTIAPSLVSIAVTPASPTIARQTTIQFIATGTYSDNSTKNLTSTAAWSSSDATVATVSSTAPTGGLASGIAAGQTTITATFGGISGNTSLTVSSATATSLAIAPLNPAIPLGTNQQFTATAGFSDGSHQDVTGVTQWSSSATGVASITVSGLATGKGIGSTTIKGTFSGLSTSTTLTVNVSNLTSITIVPNAGSIAQGTRMQLSATGTFNDGSTRDLTFLVGWNSSDATIATISGSGVASGVSPGTVSVTATLGGVSGSTSFTITNATITSIVITPASVSMPTGGYKNFAATGVFSDSSQQNLTSQVTWSSNNTAVATVQNLPGPAGFTTGISAGNATISAAFSFAGTSASGNTAVTVTSATLSSIAVTPSKAQIAPASAQEFTAVGTFSDGTQANMNPLTTWTSSNTSVAVSTHPGVVTGESSGQVTITAQDGAISGTANLLVEGATLTSIAISPQSSTVPAGFQTAFKATGTFSNGDTQDLTVFATWTSSSPGVATISNSATTAGVGTGVAKGSTTITALFAGVSSSSSLSVTTATLNSIAVTPPSASILAGQTQQFTANGSFSDGSNLDLTGQVNWTSSNPGAATIISSGVATGVSAGSSTITGELDGVQDSAVLTVQ